MNRINTAIYEPYKYFYMNHTDTAVYEPYIYRLS